jgi:hypothetical protein
MFCPACGKDVGIARRFCRFCGSSLNPSPATPAGSPNYSYVTAARAATPELEGVWGWLLFFCLILTVLAPIATIEDGSSGWLLIDVLVGLKVFFGVFVAINLWSRSEYALKLLRIYFFINIGSGILRFVIAAVAAVSYAYAGETGVVGGAMIRLIAYLVGLAILVAWLAYFQNSKRVKATYGSNL